MFLGATKRASRCVRAIATAGLIVPLFAFAPFETDRAFRARSSRAVSTVATPPPPTTPSRPRTTGRRRRRVSAESDVGRDDGRAVEEEVYVNPVAGVLSNLLPKREDVVVDAVDFAAPKRPVFDLDELAAVLDHELTEREWFVTGDVNPVYFSDSFRFRDPDVEVDGLEAYARGVRRVFDQRTARAEIVGAEARTADSIVTVTWRLSGRVNVGLEIKPYLVYTDFTVKDGLIVLQEDRFSVPGWDVFLSALLPFTVGRLTAPPAPPVEPRVVPKPKSLSLSTSTSPLDQLLGFFRSK